MIKKTILAFAMFASLSIVALGIVSASPNESEGAAPEPFAFLIIVLSETERLGLMTDERNEHMSAYLIENMIVPHTLETPLEARERLYVQGQTTFQFLLAVLSDANEKGVLSKEVIVTLSTWFIENEIAPHTSETPRQVIARLSAPPTPTPTATATATATPLPTTVSQLVKNVERGIVVITTSDGAQGTGFIIDADGLILTNAHVVERLPTVFVEMFDGSVYEADVLGIDELADVAVVRIPAERLLHPIPLGDSALAQVGDEVVAFGYPIGLKTVTSGIVSAKIVLDGVEYIQTDSAINPGNSGGPLLNRAGEAIGINTWKYEETGGGRPIDNIGFAIAINEAKARLESLTAGESVLDPTPDRIPDPEAGWNRYKNGEYGYSIDVPPGWSFATEFDDESYARFESSDGRALAEARAYDVPESFSLREFAEWRRDELLKAASDSSWEVFDAPSFDRVDETEDEFYLLSYRYQPAAENCVSEVTERLRLSDSYPDKRYGFGVSFSVCEDSLEAHVFDRDAALDTFLEWEMYTSPAYGYSVNIAPNWFLSGLSEAGEIAVFVPLGAGGAVFRVEAYDTADAYSSLEDFADWREGQLYGEAEAWEEFDPHFLNKKRERIGDREAYITAYTARKSSRHCLAGYIDLVALSSYYPEDQSGFVVLTGVCLYLMSEFGEDRLEMLDGFRH